MASSLQCQRNSTSSSLEAWPSSEYHSGSRRKSYCFSLNLVTLYSIEAFTHNQDILAHVSCFGSFLESPNDWDLWRFIDSLTTLTPVQSVGGDLCWLPEHCTSCQEFFIMCKKNKNQSLLRRNKNYFLHYLFTIGGFWATLRLLGTGFFTNWCRQEQPAETILGHFMHQLHYLENRNKNKCSHVEGYRSTNSTRHLGFLDEWCLLGFGWPRVDLNLNLLNFTSNTARFSVINITNQEIIFSILSTL